MHHLVSALGRRSIVMVGMMGCGKTSVGRRLASRLGLPFVDVDEEIELSAQKNITEIFDDHGEAFFRDGERRVIARLLDNGPQVLATGGGAFVNPQTRSRIAASGISIWLKAELPVLMKRVAKRGARPLLRSPDPEATMCRLIEERYPIYANADLTVESHDVPHDQIVSEVINALVRWLRLKQSVVIDSQSPMVEKNASMMNQNVAPIPGVGAAEARPITVDVALPERAYDVVIGSSLVEDAGRRLSQHFRRCAIVTDSNVAAHHLQRLENKLRDHGIFAGSVILPPGEGTKSFARLQDVCEHLIGLKLERDDAVIAFGGGVIGDLAGFAASVVRRGVGLVQIPTSLLAQVDSSVGGKTGINSSQGKNLIGAFYQPDLVLADLGVLATLPVREMRAGYAEVVKYALLGDALFFDWLGAHWRELFSHDEPALRHAVETCVRAKAAIVIEDEHEHGRRALLNLGHTFGHALEAYTGYGDRLLHGEAVAIGMCQAFRLSAKLELCPKGTAQTVERHLLDVGLPTRIADIPGDKPVIETLLQAMAQDKKVKGGRMTFVLARAIGDAFITRDIEPATVKDFLRDELG